MNEEFIEIARKAALDGDGDDGSLRNRMSNVYVKLSDTQQKFVRSSMLKWLIVF